MLGVICMTISNELFIDIKNFLNHSWSVTPENMVKHADEINQAANAVTELRDTGKGAVTKSVKTLLLPFLERSEV